MSLGLPRMKKEIFFSSPLEYLIITPDKKSSPPWKFHPLAREEDKDDTTGILGELLVVSCFFFQNGRVVGNGIVRVVSLPVSFSNQKIILKMNDKNRKSPC
jgi:hypothetical protein